jgi:hypothetical protein
LYKRSIFRMSIVINHKDIVVVLGSIWARRQVDRIGSVASRKLDGVCRNSYKPAIATYALLNKRYPSIVWRNYCGNRFSLELKLFSLARRLHAQ